MSVLNGRVVNGVKMKVMLADPPREESHKRLRTYWRKWWVSFLLHGTLVCFLKTLLTSYILGVFSIWPVLWYVSLTYAYWSVQSLQSNVMSCRAVVSMLQVYDKPVKWKPFDHLVTLWRLTENPAGSVTFNTRQIEVVLVTPQTHVHIMVKLRVVLFKLMMNHLT